MIVETLLTVATEVILMKLTDGAFHEISLALGYEAELGELNESLSILQDFLGNAAEKAQDGSKAAEVWVKKLKDIADEADDVFEELNYERLRGEVEPHNGMGKQILDLISRQNMAHRITKINASMEELKSKASFIELIAKKKDATPQRIREDRETNAYIGNDEIIIGRKDAVSDIVTTLTNSNMNQENLSVMAIAGMPGLGKTTLAKSVYNKGAIDVYFNKKLWVCVSDTFNVNSILAAMLGKVAPTQQALLTDLREELKEKKYLLVLDDVWNEESEKWERLMSCLSKLNSAPGSKIIVTTRSGIVASLTETLPRPKLDLLSTDECWSILKHAACSDGSLERIGREIAKKCEGLPLMAQVLGGILRSKKTPAEWSKVKDNRIWDLSKTEDRIMSVLKLSFDNLESPALKQCFSYCSAFMKDAKMERDDLIQLWMAQGFLHPSPEKSNLEMEDIGNEYFDIIFQRSLFQDARLDDDGIVIECKMHDLIHDLAERVSETGSMMRDFHKGEDVATPIIERIPEGSSGKLRSLFSNAKALPGNMFPWFKALRVLKLYGPYIKELPSSIEELKRLRYLDISFTKIERLPNSIGKLYNLQTLRARNYSLKEFPKDVQNLINLRHVYCDKGMKFPAGVLGRLMHLRTLPCEYYEVMGSEIKELAAVNLLKGELYICNLEDVRNGDEARIAKLKDKKNVRGLTFEWSKYRSITNNNNDEDVLEGLQPHSELERLEIGYFMGTKFPSWMIKLEILKEIRLWGCDRCEKVPTLGHLPHLTVVWIGEMDNLKCVGEEIYGNDIFPALKELHIHNCKELIEWMEAPEQVMVFPRLEKLEMRRCPKLRKAPSRLPSPKELEIRGDMYVEEMEIRCEKLKIRCENLTCIAHYIFGCCASLRKLAVYSCSSLQSIPDLHSFTSLRELIFENCERLESLVSSGPVSVVELLTIKGCSGLQSIPDLNLFPSLCELSIESCERLENLVSSGPVTVVELIIRSAPNLERVCLDNLTSLSHLVIDNCGKLKYLPTGLHCCASLKTLILGGFWEELDSFPGFHLEPGLQSIPALSHLTSLRQLIIEDCGRLRSLGSSGLQLPASLVGFIITNAPNLESLPSLDNLTSLSHLVIVNCGKLKYLPTGLHCCASLKTLVLGEFWEELDSFPDFHLGTGSSQLQMLKLTGWPKLKSLPQQIQDFTSLTSLWINGFDGVEALEDWLGNLTSLKILDIWRCKKLMYLPSVEAMHRLTKLQNLEIWQCPLLKERCTKYSGPEWPKISHIPDINIW